MKSRRSLYSPALLATLRKIANAFEREKIPYAVGGSLAMAAHGYHRATTDIDFFVDDAARPRAMAALRRLKFPTAPVFQGFHYIVEIPGYDIDELRADILFPADDPDWSAVQAPERVTLEKTSFDAFPLTLLILAKMQAVLDSRSNDTSKHFTDLREMYRRGLIPERELLRVARRARMLTEAQRVLRRLP